MMSKTSRITEEDTEIPVVGQAKLPSPFMKRVFDGEERRILVHPYQRKVDGKNSSRPLSFEVAGACERIFFSPSQVKAAIVTCGGICPGLNNVIRAVVNALSFHYGVEEIIGIPFGLRVCKTYPG